MKYQVFGFAFVPVELSIEVEADSPAAAVAAAAKQFDTTPRSGVITPGTEDYSSVHSWNPNTAIEITTL